MSNRRKAEDFPSKSWWNQFSCENLNKRDCSYGGFLYFFMLFCLALFTLFVYESLMIIVEKYHWIQHKKMQPVLLMREWHKLLWTSKASGSLFIWQIHFICIQIFHDRRRKFPKISFDSVRKDAIRWRNEQAYLSNLARVKFIQTAKFSNTLSINRFFLAPYYLQNCQS